MYYIDRDGSCRMVGRLHCIVILLCANYSLRYINYTLRMNSDDKGSYDSNSRKQSNKTISNEQVVRMLQLTVTLGGIYIPPSYPITSILGESTYNRHQNTIAMRSKNNHPIQSSDQCIVNVSNQDILPPAFRTAYRSQFNDRNHMNDDCDSKHDSEASGDDSNYNYNQFVKGLVDNSIHQVMEYTEAVYYIRYKDQQHEQHQKIKHIACNSNKDYSSVDIHRYISEELHKVRTMTFIEIAKHWNNQTPPSIYWDRLAAHAMIQLMERDQHIIASSGDVVVFTMSSSGRVQVTRLFNDCNRFNLIMDYFSLPSHSSTAGLTAITPIAMRLLDRSDSDSQSLGLLLLLIAVNNSSSALMQTGFIDWILPHIFNQLQ